MLFALLPLVSIQHAVVDGFVEMVVRDVVGRSQIRDRAGQPKYFVVGSRR